MPSTGVVLMTMRKGSAARSSKTDEVYTTCSWNSRTQAWRMAGSCWSTATWAIAAGFAGSSEA